MGLIIPVAFMAVALEMLVASYASSVKEAQTYTQLIAFAGFLPSLFLSVLPIRPQGWMYLIPTIGQLYFITDMSRGLPLDTMQVLSLIHISDHRPARPQRRGQEHDDAPRRRGAGAGQRPDDH